MKSRLPTDPELIHFLREELGEGMPSGGRWHVTAPVWKYQGTAKDGAPSSMAWYFVTIDGDIATAIAAASPGRTAAWGSVYVGVTLGATQWRTSLFPSKSVRGYLLPLKAGVRKAERVSEGDMVTVDLSFDALAEIFSFGACSLAQVKKDAKPARRCVAATASRIKTAAKRIPKM